MMERTESQLSTPGTAAPQVLELPAPVAQGLTRFALATRRVQLARAAGWTLACLLGGLLFVALCDRWLAIADGTRIAFSLLVYLAAAVLGTRLVRRALRIVTPADVALALERRAPGRDIEERISTTVELAALKKYPDGHSAALARRVAGEAAERIGGLDIERLADRTPARRAGKTALGLLALALALCAVPAMQMPLALLRAAFPWMNLRRPSLVEIEVLTKDLRAVAGDHVTVEARVSGRDVEAAWLETRASGFAWQRLRMDNTAPEGIGTEQAPSRHQLKIGPLHETIEFRVAAGDGLTAAHRVEVLPRPEIAALRMTVHPPAYTGLPSEELEKSSGDIAALAGSRVELRMETNVNLAAGALEFTGGRTSSLAVQGASATGLVAVREDTSYRVRLRSADGVTNPDAPLFQVRALPDLAPQVTVMQPAADASVDVNAMIGLECRAEDDLGIVAMRLIVQPDERARPLTVPLERPRGADKVWMVVQPWDLAGLFLGAGGTVRYRVEAEDAKGSVGRSDERMLRVSAGEGRDQARALRPLQDAQRRVGEVRRQLARIRADVDEMRIVFQAQDPAFQAAERLLAVEAIHRAAREAGAASGDLAKAAGFAGQADLRTLLTGLSGALERFGAGTLSALHRAADRAATTQAAEVAAGLDVVARLTPAAEKEILRLHEGLTAAQRFVEAADLEARSAEVQEHLRQAAPLLVGAAGWTPDGAVLPGLLAEHHRGSRFAELLRRTVSLELATPERRDPALGSGPQGIRWQGEMLAPAKGRYVFRAEGCVRLLVGGKTLFDRRRALILDDRDPGFAVQGTWPESPGGFEKRCLYHAEGAGKETATWTFTGVPRGRYRVYATWTPHGNRAPKAPFTVLDGAEALATLRFDQREAPTDLREDGAAWTDFGQSFEFQSGTVTVRLSDQGGGYAIADAVRLERLDGAGAEDGEAALELEAGWHDILFEFTAKDARETCRLQRAGPGLPMGAIPAEHLRHKGTALAVTDPHVKTGMAKGASAAGVRRALVRLQSLVESARALAPRLQRAASLPPEPDKHGQEEGATWNAGTLRETLDLAGVKVATPALALPLHQWTQRWPNYVHAYGKVRARYEAEMRKWAAQMADETYRLASRLRRVQDDAAAAAQAYQELAREAARKPEDAERAQAMARADAAVRALAEDLRRQAIEIAADLRQAAHDAERALGERQALQAMAHAAQHMARGPAEDLDRRLSQARTPEDLAESSKKAPNLGQHAQDLGQQAGQLAQHADRFERAVALREAMQDMARRSEEAAKALPRTADAEAAVAQQHAAAALEDTGEQARAALAQAQGRVALGWQPAAHAANHPVPKQAAEMLRKRADEALQGHDGEAKDLAEAEQAAGKLFEHARLAREAAEAIDRDLAALGQQGNGDPAAELRQAAAEAQAAGKALEKLPPEKPLTGDEAPVLQAASEHADEAVRATEQVAEQLALEAEAMREAARDEAAKAQATDLTRLAAAVQREAHDRLAPAAHALERVRRQNAELPKEFGQAAEASAKTLNRLAEAAAQLRSNHPQHREAGRKALDEILPREAHEELDEALAAGERLDALAEELKRAAEGEGAEPAAPDQGAQGQPGEAGPEEANLDERLAAQRNELAKALHAGEGAEALREALAERAAEWAGKLREQAQRDRHLAEHLEKARGMERQAREAIAREGAELAEGLRAAGKRAQAAAEGAKGKHAERALGQAGEQLPKAGDALAALAEKAAAAPLDELAGELDREAAELEKPLAALAGHLGAPDDPATRDAQAAGAQAREAAGREGEWAGELRAAQRARNLALAGHEAAQAGREELDAQIAAALEAFERHAGAGEGVQEGLQALRRDAAPPRREGATGEAGRQGEGQPGAQGQAGQDHPSRPQAQPGQEGQSPSQGPSGQQSQSGNQGQQGPSGQGQAGAQAPHAQGAPGLEAAARHARQQAERLARMAAQMDRVAAGMRGKRGAPARRLAEGASASPAADALQALTQAQAAAQTGGEGQARAMAGQAAQLLQQAAQAARGQATGLQTAGSAEAQALAMGEGQGQSGQPSQTPAQGGGQSGMGSRAASQGGFAPTPPKGLPIDRETWNRLPDDLRRDLLNAAGSRFPAEFEMSIRRYFKNIAETREETPR